MLELLWPLLCGARAFVFVVERLDGLTGAQQTNITALVRRVAWERYHQVVDSRAVVAIRWWRQYTRARSFLLRQAPRFSLQRQPSPVVVSAKTRMITFAPPPHDDNHHHHHHTTAVGWSYRTSTHGLFCFIPLVIVVLITGCSVVVSCFFGPFFFVRVPFFCYYQYHFFNLL